MSFADELRKTSSEKKREIEKAIAERDKIKEYFEDILECCSEEASYGRNELEYPIPRYRESVRSSEMSSHDAEKLKNMLTKEGLHVEIERNQVYHWEAYGNTEDLYVWSSEKLQKKARERDWATIGTQCVFKIEW